MVIDELDQYRIRLEKRAALLAQGVLPYPSKPDFPITAKVHDLADRFSDFERKPAGIGTAGRISRLRSHGDLCFVDLVDASGKIQLAIGKDELGKSFSLWNDSVDIGDIVLVFGKPFRTKRGEPTIRVERFQLLTKALLPLPDKRKGLTDVESRLRHRELDLLTNQVTRDRFVFRARLIHCLRDFLDQNGFLEVETPILQALPGGTNAKPFVTHHEALNQDLFLRIAPELYLKRLLIGGFERVYEIARCFRNEGIDRDHSPEFTQLEFYMAYADYQDMMSFTEQLLATVSNQLSLNTFQGEDGVELSFAKPFHRIRFHDALKKYAQLDIGRFPDSPKLATEAERRGVVIEKTYGRGKILDEVFKKLVRPKLVQPTFVTDLPIELSPLAKKRKEASHEAERFQLVVAGTELANAFSELNDPIDQNARFVEQQALREAGDDEAQPHDKEYVQSLNYGLPPAAGIGIGLDRLAAIFTGSPTIRDVILFPTLRSSNHA